MRRVQKTVGYGRIAAAEYDWDWQCTDPLDGYPIILLHGANAWANYSGVAGQGILHRPLIQLPYYLGWEGIPSVAGYMGGDTFANNASMTHIDNARVLLEALGIDASKVHLFGASMGFALATRYAAENPADVVSLCGLIPLTNLNYLYTNNIGGLQATVAAAWGVTAPAALPAEADTMSYAGDIAAANIPTRLYYSDPDTLIRPVDVTDFGTAADAEVTLQVGANGHTVTSERDMANLGQGLWSTYTGWIKSFAA